MTSSRVSARPPICSPGWCPYPIAENNLFIVDKHANCSSWGLLNGEFPALPCSPVATDDMSWSRIKSRFGD